MLAAQQTLVELPEASNSDNAPTKPAVVLPPALTDEAAAARANVCYEARQSAIEGLGVFATELIPAGHPWWTFDPTRHLFVTPAQHRLVLWAARLNPEKFAKLEDAMHRYCFHSVTHDTGVFCLDDSRYTNYSSTPNSRPARSYYAEHGYHLPLSIYSHVALRDIQPGEEIVENYAEYDGGEWCNFLSGAWVDDPEAPACELGEKPDKGRHVIFRLDAEQLKVIRESQLPPGPGRAFFDVLDLEGDGAVVAFDVEN